MGLTDELARIPGRFITGRFITGRFIIQREKQLVVGAALTGFVHRSHPMQPPIHVDFFDRIMKETAMETASFIQTVDCCKSTSTKEKAQSTRRAGETCM